MTPGVVKHSRHTWAMDRLGRLMAARELNGRPGGVALLLRVAFTLALTLGACETREDEPFAEDCSVVGTRLYLCQNLSKDENDNYSQRCVARGKRVHRVHRADDDCGLLWAEAAEA